MFLNTWVLFAFQASSCRAVCQEGTDLSVSITDLGQPCSTVPRQVVSSGLKRAITSVSSTGVRRTLSIQAIDWRNRRLKQKHVGQLSCHYQRGGPWNRRHARQHTQHRVDMQLRRSASAAVRLALKPEGWEASTGTQGAKTGWQSFSELLNRSVSLGLIYGLPGRGAEIQLQDGRSWSKAWNEGNM